MKKTKNFGLIVNEKNSNNFNEVFKTYCSKQVYRFKENVIYLLPELFDIQTLAKDNKKPQFVAPLLQVNANFLNNTKLNLFNFAKNYSFTNNYKFEKLKQVINLKSGTNESTSQMFYATNKTNNHFKAVFLYKWIIVAFVVDGCAYVLENTFKLATRKKQKALATIGGQVVENLKLFLARTNTQISKDNLKLLEEKDFIQKMLNTQIAKNQPMLLDFEDYKSKYKCFDLMFKFYGMDDSKTIANDFLPYFANNNIIGVSTDITNNLNKNIDLVKLKKDLKARYQV